MILDPQVVTLIGVGGTLVGIIVGWFAVRRGQREEAKAEAVKVEITVQTSAKLREHMKGISRDCAKEQIELAAKERGWLDAKDGRLIAEQIDRIEESVKELHEKIENGLAGRIVDQSTKQLLKALEEKGLFNPGLGHLPIQKE